MSCRLNVIVSGGTGSGKTTTLNALSSFIDNAERVLQVLLTACSAQGCSLVMVTHSAKAASHLNHVLNLTDHQLAELQPANKA